MIFFDLFYDGNGNIIVKVVSSIVLCKKCSVSIYIYIYVLFFFVEFFSTFTVKILNTLYMNNHYTSIVLDDEQSSLLCEELSLWLSGNFLTLDLFFVS